MKKTKNLFTYAPNELSQDAFLLWLLNGWDSTNKDVASASKQLLQALLQLPDNNFNIEDLSTYAQLQSMDIVIECIIDDIFHAVVIEDKTTSHAQKHQLEDYPKRLANHFPSANQYHHVLYKSYLILDEDRERMENAEWYVLDIRNIQELFSSLSITPQNDILVHYIEYIDSLYHVLTDPLDNIPLNDWTKDHWFNFFQHTDWSFINNIESGIKNWRNHYYLISFMIKGNWKKLPYIEIRSRDFYDETFLIRVLVYNLSEEVLKQKKELFKDNLRNSELYKVQNHPQQIGSNQHTEQVTTKAELLTLIKKYVDEYHKLMV